MITLFAMWTPGPIELVVVIFVFFFVVISPLLNLMVFRWIFRINEQIELLTQIHDELRKLRLRKYPEKREAEK